MTKSTPHLHHIGMHVSSHYDHTKELVLFTEGNGRALTALLPEVLGKMIRAAWDMNPSPLALNEAQLLRVFRQKGRVITPQDRELRWRFWNEYNRVMDMPKPTLMTMSYVLGRSIAKEHFYKTYINDPLTLAYLVLPPAHYQADLELSLEVAMVRVRAILEMDILNKDGSPNAMAMDKILRIFESLHAKLYGVRVKTGPKPKGAKEPEEDETIEETISEKLARMRAAKESLLAEKQSKLEVESAKPVEGTV